MDVYYYWCHRFLHLRLPYRYIHKMHHRVSDSSDAWLARRASPSHISLIAPQVHVPYCSAGFYLHPAEVLLLDQGAAFVAATLFPSMRFWTVLLLQLLLPIRACHEHLGYVFPWDIDNSALGTQKVTHHGIHHQPAGHKCVFLHMALGCSPQHSDHFPNQGSTTAHHSSRSWMTSSAPGTGRRPRRGAKTSECPGHAFCLTAHAYSGGRPRCRGGVSAA